MCRSVRADSRLATLAQARSALALLVDNRGQLLGAGQLGVGLAGKFVFQLVRQFVLASRFDCRNRRLHHFNMIDHGLAHAECGHALRHRLWSLGRWQAGGVLELAEHSFGFVLFVHQFAQLLRQPFAFAGMQFGFDALSGLFFWHGLASPWVLFDAKELSVILTILLMGPPAERSHAGAGFNRWADLLTNR